MTLFRESPMMWAPIADNDTDDASPLTPKMNGMTP